MINQAAQTQQKSEQQSQKSLLLRRALQANGVFSGLSGLVLTFGAGPLAAFLGLDSPLILVIIGVTLVLYAVGLFQQAAREPLNRQVAITAIALDVAWVIGSIALLLTDWVLFTTGGQWAIPIVADIVAVFAAVQYYGLRRL